MTDYFDQADRLIRSGNVTADAAAIAYAVLALAQAVNGYEPPVITPELKGDFL